MIEKFTVIDLIRTRSASVCTLVGNTVKFNNQTAQELSWPSHVQFLIDTKSKQFAIRSCKPDAPNAVKFSKPEGIQKGQIKMGLPAVVGILRRLMGWKLDQDWNLPGIYFAEDQAIVYDLSSAYEPRHRNSAKSEVTDSENEF